MAPLKLLKDSFTLLKSLCYYHHPSSNGNQASSIYGLRHIFIGSQKYLYHVRHIFLSCHRHSYSVTDILIPPLTTYMSRTTELQHHPLFPFFYPTRLSINYCRVGGMQVALFWSRLEAWMQPILQKFWEHQPGTSCSPIQSRNDIQNQWDEGSALRQLCEFLSHHTWKSNCRRGDLTSPPLLFPCLSASHLVAVLRR